MSGAISGEAAAKIEEVRSVFRPQPTAKENEDRKLRAGGVGL
jgi:hypothetical protein